MMKIFMNILAVIAGVVFGSIINMGLIQLGTFIIPPPSGTDMSSMESLKFAMHLFETKHFIFPFLAHALGTLSGAIVAGAIASTRKMTFALIIGGLFMIGGIVNVIMLPSPVWFIVLDLAVAYIPMALLGGFIALRFKKDKPADQDQ